MFEYNFNSFIVPSFLDDNSFRPLKFFIIKEIPYFSLSASIYSKNNGYLAQTAAKFSEVTRFRKLSGNWQALIFSSPDKFFHLVVSFIVQNLWASFLKELFELYRTMMLSAYQHSKICKR